MNETVNLDACAEIAQNLETCLDEGQNAAFQIWTLNISRRETKEKLILLSYPDNECFVDQKKQRSFKSVICYLTDLSFDIWQIQYRPNILKLESKKVDDIVSL